MSEEKITKVACAQLVYAAENGHKRTLMISGALSATAIFVTLFIPLLGIALMLLNTIYAAFMWKRQSMKLNYLKAKYFKTPPAGGI